jgi:hypothetical protein
MKRLITITLSVFLIALVANIANSQVVTFNNTYGQMPYNYGKKIIQANDGGYYILGNESGNIANTNIHIIRTDSLGIILFEKTIGDASVYSANDFVRTSDKGFLITGLTNNHPEKGYDVLLVKTDSNANVQWEKTYGGSDWDMGNSVIETNDNAFLISGQTFSYGPGGENIYIIKTNFNGDTLWTKVFGGDSTDYALSATMRFDSTYLIGATTNSFGHGNYDGYILNLDQNGDTLLTQTYGEEKEDIIYSIKQTPDSGFVFVGSTMSYNAIEHDGWLMKFDKSSNFIWMLPESWNILPGDDLFKDVIITDSAQYALAGYTTSFGSGGRDAAFYLMGEHNQFKCSHTDGSIGDEEANQVIQTSDSAFALIGSTDYMGTGLANIYLIKMGLNCVYDLTTEHIIGIDSPDSTNSAKSISITPNISNGIYWINFPSTYLSEYKIIIRDIQGRILFSDNVQNLHQQSFKVNITNIANGLYFITIFDKQKAITFKIIKSGD